MSARSFYGGSGGGGPAASTVTAGRITAAGVVTLAANAAWVAVPGLTFTTPAEVGDALSVSIGLLIEWSNPVDYFDLAVIGSGGTIVRRSSTGTSAATGVNRGDPAFYPNPGGFVRTDCPWAFTVAGDDVVSGNVQISLIATGPGGATVYASSDYPTRYWVLRQPA